ncbi:protein NRT1/ PTR FAMILY 5.6-like [Lycium barbarum]|uniref:protein NRT1/ PTR FAMILY 5.6-like n=1 Tax=Lycium barbarum TaxID=112863 RepID=UPI00293EA1CC|nr:protein NRT1/ PTR FAMILY 5.6-like [Lycium barbarum]
MFFSYSLSGHFTKWWRKAAFFSKAAIFISGLIGMHGIVEYALLATLITQLEDDLGLRSAAIAVNMFEGLSSLFVIVVSQLSESYFGRFKVILFTNAAFILGLGMLWRLSHQNDAAVYEALLWDNDAVVYVALVVLSFGKAGRDHTLKAFLADQLWCRKDQEPNLRRDEQNPQKCGKISLILSRIASITRKINPRRIKDDFEEDKEVIETRREFYWSISWIFGIIVATLSRFVGWKGILEISTIAVAAGFSMFLLGIPFYERKKPSPSPLGYIFKVVKVALSKRHMDYPVSPNQLCKNNKSDTQILPHIAFLRWLDKAAILEASTTEQLAETAEETVFEVAKVKDVKRLISMFPLWSTFYVYSLVGATANTFFYKQVKHMNDHLGRISNMPIVVFVIIKPFTSSITSNICSWFKNRSNARRPPLNRIRFGMFFSIICCAVASGVEVYRLHDQISVFWLTPQFFLVGLMEGLSESGLQDFFETQVCESMKEYGPQFSEFSTGIGKFLSVIFILIFLFWFNEEFETSRLDKYYAVLMVPTFLNFVFCCFISNWYANQPYDTINAAQELEDGVADVIANKNSGFEIAQELEHGAVEDSTNVVSGSTR